MSNECKTVKYIILKNFSHFSMTNVDGIVELSISDMILYIYIYIYFFENIKNYMVNHLK